MIMSRKRAISAITQRSNDGKPLWLMIGGDSDGRRITFSGDHQEYIELAKKAPPFAQGSGATSIRRYEHERDLYRAVYFFLGDSVSCFYAHISLNELEAFQRLCARYPEQEDES